MLQQNFDKIDALFWRNFFSPEIVVVLDLGHLEDLAALQTPLVTDQLINPFPPTALQRRHAQTVSRLVL